MWVAGSMCIIRTVMSDSPVTSQHWFNFREYLTEWDGKIIMNGEYVLAEYVDYDHSRRQTQEKHSK